MTDISINSNNLKIGVKPVSEPVSPSNALVLRQNTLPAKVVPKEKLGLSKALTSKGKMLPVAQNVGIQLFSEGAKSGGSHAYQILLNDAIVKNPEVLRSFTIQAAQHSNNALGRVIIESAAFYPDKLEDVLNYAAEKDFYQMKKTVNQVYKAAQKNGVQIKQKFPTGAISKGMAVNYAKDIVRSGLIGIPLDMAFNIFSYNSDKIDAKTYAAKSLNGFFSWSAFEAGIVGTTVVASTIAGQKIGPFARTALGVGVGMITSSLYHKTVGHRIEEKLKDVIPEKVAKPVADNINRFFGKPVDKYILQPIKNNPKTAIAVGGTLATALTIKYPVGFGKNFLLGMTAATAIGVAGNLGLTYALGNSNSHPVFNATDHDVLNKTLKIKGNDGKEISIAISAKDFSTLEQEISEQADLQGQVSFKGDTLSVPQETIVKMGKNIEQLKGSAEPEVLPALDIHPTAAELKEAMDIEARYKQNKNSISEAESLRYLNVLQRFEKASSEVQNQILTEYQQLQ